MGQQVMVVGPNGESIQVETSSGSTPPAPGTPPQAVPPGGKGAAKPGEKKGEAGAPADDGKQGEKGAETIKREKDPPAPPDKKELEVHPDEKGLVQFQFRHQSWPDVLRWLADVSSMSLDWQELPGDYLNLATRRPYTIEETRDLFNRHLLARGYTMLELDGVIQVCKTENINTALVPKVTVEELSQLPPNRYVRVSFPLESLLAEEVVEEFRPLISTNGKLLPLQSTNRLEAMDAAGNLKELHRILSDEQSEAARSNLAREFVLQYVRAADAKSQLEMFLGLQKSSAGDSNSSSSRQMQMMQEMMQQQQQQMMQQAQARGGAPGAVDKSKKRPTEVYLVANNRQNSVIVHAQPNKMAIVEAFIQRIDVPNENAEDFSSMQNRMQVYRLASLSPKQLVASLLNMDALEPTTRLEVDEANNAVIAHASLADQYAIQKVIERLDGSARSFEMIQLRRLKADEVAGTIKFLMGADKDKKDDSQNSRRYFFYDPWGNRDDDSKNKNDDGFRVGASIADNQLLLWCNDRERKEVTNLLVKLGELPAEGVKPNPFRTIDASRSRDTLEYLRQLQEKWRAVSPNPLVLPSEDQFDAPPAKRSPPAEPASEERPPTAESEPTKPSANTPILHDSQAPSGKFVLTEETTENLTEASSQEASIPASAGPQPADNTHPINRQVGLPGSPTPPIEIRFDSDGNLLLLSEDLEALDRLESLMLRDAPPKRPYDVFQIHNARATWIELNLKDYFKDDSSQNRGDGRTTYYFFDVPPPSSKKDDPQLGSKRELKFISDIDTNTIIAIGATDAQRKLIGELIALWDTPDPKKAKDARYQRLIRIQYSRAEVIEQAVKDAYRDFLSQNDKAFQRNDENGRKGSEEKFDRSSSNRKFSIGVDKVTNIMIVSAEGEDFLNVICDVIEQLDMAAKPSGTVQVVPFETGGSAKSMEKAFKAMMESASKQPPPPNGKQGNNPNGQGGDGNRGQNNADQ